jgi:hypothetical protein
MLLAHAAADARTDFVTHERSNQEFTARERRVAFGDGGQRRQRNRAAMHHSVAVDVVQLKALHLRAVDQRGIGR